MKIYIFTKSYLPTIGGVENSVFYLTKNFSKQNIAVEIISFDGQTDNETSELVEGGTLRRFFLKKSKFPNISYKNLVQKTAYVVNKVLTIDKNAHILTRNSPIALGIVQNNYKVVHIFPTISKLNVAGLYPSNNLVFRILKLIDYYSLFLIEKQLVQHPKARLAVFSLLMKKHILNEYNSDKNIEVVYPGVDFEVFKPVVDQDKDLMARKYILYVGRLSKAKNIDFLLQSFKLIKEDCDLYIIGEGPEKERLQSLAADLGIADKVVFLGKHVAKLASFYSHAQLTALPTKIETFGQVIIESLACGTPVVALGNHPNFNTAASEIIQEHYNGEVVSEEKTSHYAKAIAKVLANPKYSEKNITYCKSKFNWNLCSKRLIELLNE